MSLADNDGFEEGYQVAMQKVREAIEGIYNRHNMGMQFHLNIKTAEKELGMDDEGRK